MTAPLSITTTIHVNNSLVSHRLVERTQIPASGYSYREGVTEVLSIDSCAVNFTKRANAAAR